MNYFEFYDIPLSFKIDEAGLRQVYYRKSKQYHPDFHTLSTVSHQEEMLDLSTLNNKAYKTLSDPDRRMRYILEIKGLLGEEDKQPQLPQDFLMDMMEINEHLMELEFDFDQSRYDQVLAALSALESDLSNHITPVLESYPTSADPDADLEKVKEYYLKKRYLLRIHENLAKFAAPKG